MGDQSPSKLSMTGELQCCSYFAGNFLQFTVPFLPLWRVDRPYLLRSGPSSLLLKDPSQAQVTLANISMIISGPVLAVASCKNQELQTISVVLAFAFKKHLWFFSKIRQKLHHDFICISLFSVRERHVTSVSWDKFYSRLTSGGSKHAQSSRSRNLNTS